MTNAPSDSVKGEKRAVRTGDPEAMDRMLKQALGPVILPEAVWSGLEERLAAEIQPYGQSGRDPVPVLAAVASFCALFQLYPASGGPLSDLMAGYVLEGVTTVERWALTLFTLISGG